MNHAEQCRAADPVRGAAPLFPRLRILYKAELRKLPILVRAFDLAGFVPLERGNPEQSLPAIERAAAALREGASFLILPGGDPQPDGGAVALQEGGVHYGNQGWSPRGAGRDRRGTRGNEEGSPIIRPVTVRLRFGPPVETAGMTMDDRDDLVEECEARAHSDDVEGLALRGPLLIAEC